VTDRIVARFPSTADDAAIQNTIKAYDLVDTKEPSRRLGRRVLRVPRARIAEVISIANSLHEDPATLWATPEILAPVVKQQINDPLYNDQWHLNNLGGVANLTADADIDLPEAWSLSSNPDPAWMIHQGNAAIVVSVPDPDGVDTQHPDLAANSIGSRGGVTDPHGTGCAGLAVGDGNTIGGRGVAPFCSLLGAEATNSSEAVDAFDWSVEHGAAVISNSWSITTLFQDLVDAIQSAVADGREGRGCVVLFAAGNDFGTVEQNNPYAALDEVICVGASTSMDVHAAYSNTGESDDTVDVVAPSGPAADSEFGTFTNTDARGQYLRTTDQTGTDGYNNSIPLGPTDLADLDYTELFSGTSGATPVAAGVAALVLSTNPDLTAGEAKQILYDSADTIDAGHADYPRFYGNGRVNAYEAVQQALIGHYTTGDLRFQDIVGVSWELNPRTIGAGGTFELAGVELNSTQRAQMDRILAAWLVLDMEDVDNGTEVSVENGLGRLISHCPPTGSGNRRPVIMSLPVDEVIFQETNGPFVLRNNDWLFGTVKLYEASLSVLYVHADSETDPTVTGGWRFPQPGVPGSAVGWLWGYLDSSPEHVQTGQPLEEQASTSTY
ncbi:MAG: S8 family serine peptidase, partial [Planctomycetes bacterium]|nr:S8 family serine peptidase [Planctomycetota bacterium]